MKYPIGIQNFEKIRREGYVYVDKTEQIYRLVNEGSYHFVANGEGVYNPFSLLNTLRRQRFGRYWFETGTPSYLVDVMKQDNYPLPDLTQEQVTGDFLNSIDSMSSNPIPLIYQSGYLTIKDYDPEFGFYTEVERETSNGRMDMTVQTKDYIYIFEFKLDGSADEALKQIDDRGYAKPFALDKRKLIKVGVNFSLEKRCIEEWKDE